MKNLLFVLILVFATSLYAQTKTPLTGVWATGQQNTKVEIFESGGRLNGKIISSDNEHVKPGLIMLKDFKPDGEGWKAKIYSLRRKEWFDVALKPDGKQLSLVVSRGFLSKTISWERSH